MFCSNGMEKRLNILFVEDNLIEIMKLKRAISDLQLNHNLIEAENGEVALELLNKDKITTDLILLDLNMPKMNGLEFLAAMRAEENLSHLPVVILTTSSNGLDVMEAYKLGVSGYILKPLKYDEYVQKIKYTLLYWSNNELISNL